MTRERAKELLPIIAAYAEGKDIEMFIYSPQDKWVPVQDPWWDEKTIYRIKPDPREWWIVGCTAYTTERDARCMSQFDPKKENSIIHVREAV